MKIASRKIMKNVDFIMNFSLFLNFLKSIFRPIMKRRKYIPRLDRKFNVEEDVIVVKGFFIARTAPMISAAKIQGILAFSINLPMKKVNIKNPAKKMNKFTTIFVF